MCDWNFYAYYDSQDLLITDNKAIRALFWRSRPRVIAKTILCLPLYLMSNWFFTLKLLSGIHFRTLYVCCKKIVDIVSLQLISQIWRSMFADNYKAVADRNLSRYVLVFAILVGYCHFTTLFWVINRFQSDLEMYQASNPNSPLPDWLSSNPKVFVHYCYFVMTTISTNGYGDITPNKDTNLSEMFFAMFLMLIGVMLMSGVIALTNNFLNELRISIQKHKQKVKDFDHWFRVLQRKSNTTFSVDLMRRVKRFFSFLLTSEFNNTLYSEEFFLQLPENLGKDLELEYAQRHEQLFDGLFSKFSEPFCIKIIKHSQALCWEKGDLLIKRGEFLPGVFFLAKGNIQVFYQVPEHVARIYKKGSSLGWSCINDKPSHFTFKAQELTLTLFLSVDSLEGIFEEFPADYLMYLKMAADEERALKSELAFLKSLISTQGVQGHQKLLKLAQSMDMEASNNGSMGQTSMSSNRQRRQSAYIDKNLGFGGASQAKNRRGSLQMTSPSALMQSSEVVSGIAIARLLLGSEGNSIIEGIQGLLKSAILVQPNTSQASGKTRYMQGGIPEPEPEANLGKATELLMTEATSVDLSKFSNALEIASLKARILEDSFELDEGPLSVDVEILEGMNFDNLLAIGEKNWEYYEKLIEQNKKFGHRMHQDQGGNTFDDEDYGQAEDELDRSILMHMPEVSIRLDEPISCKQYFRCVGTMKLLESKAIHLQRRWRVFEAVSKLQLHKQLLKLRFCQEEDIDIGMLGGALQLINEQEEKLKGDLQAHLGVSHSTYMLEIQELIHW
jgi:CRP-like cAMP-binding protein